MKPTFNSLSVLAVLGFTGFLAFVGNGYDSTVVFSFAYFFYLGYLWIRPDELFWEYVFKSATWTLAVNALFLMVWVSVYYLANLDEPFINMGFWLNFGLIHTLFNAILIGYISRDGISA